MGERNRFVSSARSVVRLLPVLVTIAWALPAPSSSACPRYEVTIIQPPDCPPNIPQGTSGQGINDLPAIVGHYNICLGDNFQAFYWTEDTGIVDLGFPPDDVDSRAYDVNNNQDIVGIRTTADQALGFLGYLLQDGGQFTDLGTLPGGDWSEAYAVNGSTRIIGFWGNTVTGVPTSTAAFVWQGGLMTDLTGDLGTPKSSANDVNDAGKVTGWMGTSFLTDAHAFIWDDGEVVDLGPIPGGFTSEGLAINAVDQVVGLGRLPYGQSGVARHAFIWTGAQMVDLGALPGLSECFAHDINVHGQVVGYCWNFGQTPRAFIWVNNVIMDLNDLLVPGSQVEIKVASAINDAGQIVGEGVAFGQGSVAVLLTPIDAVGDLNGDGVVDAHDLAMLLGAWGPCAEGDCCQADINEDGFVNPSDLAQLLGNWG